jgi:hypothetical protein
MIDKIKPLLVLLLISISAAAQSQTLIEAFARVAEGKA